ncbi:type VII secretion system-associated protein [Streptomyces tauricus]|uniref:type VII secretion system-associated protein n=1 Tax=Streptomyces tauricus TaxID=68274 RepID=UPI00387F1914
MPELTSEPMPGPAPLSVPDEIREAGRLAPDHWLGVVDPMWAGEGEPPEWVVVGRWRSGAAGEIEEWQDNPEYRPSPAALGWPAPEDEVDRAVQLAVTGYGPGEAVTEALLHHEVAVLTSPGGGPLCAVTPDGTPAVPLYTSPVFLRAAGRLAYELVGLDDLVPQVPDDHVLYLNPSGPAGMTLELDAVRAALRGSVGEGRQVRTAADGGDARSDVPAVAAAATPTVSVASGDWTAVGGTATGTSTSTSTGTGSRRVRGTDA